MKATPLPPPRARGRFSGTIMSFDSNPIPPPASSTTPMPSALPVSMPLPPILSSYADSHVENEGAIPQHRTQSGLPLSKAQELDLVEVALSLSDEYRVGSKGSFWQKVSALFESQAGRMYSAVACTRKMKKLAETRVAAVARKRTGKIGTASALDAALYQWIEILDVRRTEEYDKAARPLQTYEALQQAEVIRGSMIHRQGHKRTRQSTATTDTKGLDNPADIYADALKPLEKRIRTSVVAEEMEHRKKFEKISERFVDISEKSVTSQRQSQGPSESTSTIPEPQITYSRRLDDFSADLHRLEAKMHKRFDDLMDKFDNLTDVLLARAAAGLLGV